MKAIIIALALLSGTVQAAQVTEADCSNRAQAAYATATARDMGRDQRDLIRYIDTKQPVEQRVTLKRIVFNVYTSSTSPDAAFSSEKSKCQSEIFRNKK